MELFYKPRFIRKLARLEKPLQDEALEKIELFKNPANHESLKVHKLHGRLDGFFSFSVNYRYRIVFMKLSDDSVSLLSIGTHAVYDE